MATQMEISASRNIAKSMSDRDLEWQVANQKKLRIPNDLNKVFKDELARRKANA